MVMVKFFWVEIINFGGLSIIAYDLEKTTHCKNL